MKSKVAEPGSTAPLWHPKFQRAAAQPHPLVASRLSLTISPQNAAMPVIARPRISAWMSCVPS